MDKDLSVCTISIEVVCWSDLDEASLLVLIKGSLDTRPRFLSFKFDLGGANGGRKVHRSMYN